MYDVAVIGGGPAGCAAAITLARNGLSVVVLERVSGSPEGFCGEFLSPDGVGSLDLLGVLSDVLEAAPPTVRRWSLHGRTVSLDGRLPGPALGISRRVLDPTLRMAARREGADVREGARVRRVRELDSGGFTLSAGEQTVTARHVVGAAGRSARIPGLDPESKARTREFVAFKAHFRSSDRGQVIRLFPLGGAYVGVGAVEGGKINVCFLARRSAWEAAGTRPDALLDEACSSHQRWAECWRPLEHLSERWLTTGGLYFRPRTTTPRPGVTLCGDAVGVISPFLGEGMSMALEAGRLAGDMVSELIDAPNRLVDLYGRAWRRRFGARMRWGERLQRVLLSERPDRILRLASLLPGLPNAIARRSRPSRLVRLGASALRGRQMAESLE